MFFSIFYLILHQEFNELIETGKSLSQMKSADVTLKRRIKQRNVIIDRLVYH